MDMTRPPQTEALNALLVREAQQEAANLRSELYSARRVAEERRQAAERLEQLRGQLELTVRDQQAELNHLGAQVRELHALRQHCQQLEAMVAALQQDNEALKEARQKAVQEAEQSNRARQAAENSKALLEGERSRLAKSRDELATQLRVAQQRAREADEEQLRAEEEAAALRAELQVYQTDGRGSPGDGNGALSGPTSDLLAQLDSERESRLALFDSFQAVKAELSQNSATVNDQKQEIQLLREELAALKHESSSYVGDLGRLQHQLSQTQLELDQSRQRQAALETQAQKLKAHILELQNTTDSPRVSSSNSGLPSSTPHPTPLQPHSAQTHGPSQPHPAPSHPAELNGKLLSLSSRSESTSTAGGHEEPDFSAQVQALERRVAMFKKSRDKLLLEVDRQSAELERLALENRTMQEELAQTRGFSQLWEVQAQSSLLKLDHLKDLLEESAQWESVSSDVAGTGTSQTRSISGDLVTRLPPDGWAKSSNTSLHSEGHVGAGSIIGNGVLNDTTRGGLSGSSSGNANGASNGAGLPNGQHTGHGEPGSGLTMHQLQSLLFREQAKSAKLDVHVRALCSELMKVQKANAVLLKSRVPLLSRIESRVAQLHRAAVAL